MIGGGAARHKVSRLRRVFLGNAVIDLPRAIDRRAFIQRPRPVPFFQIDFTQTRVLLLTPYASNRKVRGIVMYRGGRATFLDLGGLGQICLFFA